MSNQALKSFKEKNKQMLEKIIRDKYIIFKEITLSSGIKSPYYIDLRQGFSNYEFMDEITDLLRFFINNKILNTNNNINTNNVDNNTVNRVGNNKNGDKNDDNGDNNDDNDNDDNDDNDDDNDNDDNEDTNFKLCCLPLGSVPYGTILSNKLNIPMIVARDKAKKYGKKRAIEGSMSFDDNVLILDDVLTTGESIINGIKKITDNGGVVNDIFVIINRNEGGEENIKYFYPDVKIHSLFTINNIINHLEIDNQNGQNKFIIESIKFHKEKSLKNLFNKIKKLNNKISPFYNSYTNQWYLDKYIDILNPKSINLEDSINIDKPLTLNEPLNEENKNSSNNIFNYEDNQLLNSKWCIGRIIIDLSNESDWKKIKGIINNSLVKINNLKVNKINAFILNFKNIIGLDYNIFKELLELKHKYLFNIYSKMNININSYCKYKYDIDKRNTYFNSLINEKIYYDIYNNNLDKHKDIEKQLKNNNNIAHIPLTSNIISSCIDLIILDFNLNNEDDINYLIDFLNNYLENNKGIKCNKILLNFIFSNIEDNLKSIKNNEELWDSLINFFYTKNKNNLIQGLIINYDYLSNTSNIKLTKQKQKLNNIIPMILDLNDFTLTKDMINSIKNIDNHLNIKLNDDNPKNEIINEENIVFNRNIFNNNFNFFILGDNLVNSDNYNLQFFNYNKYIFDQLFNVYKNNFLLKNLSKELEILYHNDTLNNNGNNDNNDINNNDNNNNSLSDNKINENNDTNTDNNFGFRHNNEYYINQLKEFDNQIENNELVTKYENIFYGKHTIQSSERKKNINKLYLSKIKNNKLNLDKVNKIIINNNNYKEKIENNKKNTYVYYLKQNIDNGLFNNLMNNGFSKTLLLYSRYYLDEL